MAKTVLKKGQKVDVQTKTGRGYSYKFTTLAQIHEWLEENRLRYYAFIKNVEGSDYIFIQRYSVNADGFDPQAIGEPLQEARIPQQIQGLQDYGGVLTSLRRYSLLMAFGLACEDDEKKSDLDETKEKWQKWHTPNPDKPASEKQIETIRKLCARAGKGLDEMNKIVAYAKSQALASKCIEKLGEEINKKENQ